jgi:hypothetical protein
MTKFAVDLSDPRVQAMLGGQRPATGNARQVVQLAGDAPDPTGETDRTGLLSTHRLNAGKVEVAVVFGDVIMTVDVYAVPSPLTIHIICPRCHKRSMIHADRKNIEFSPKAMNPQFRRVLLLSCASALPELAHLEFGKLSVEPFECAWEIGDSVHVPGTVHTGASLCRLRLAIDENRAREV